jgi:flagellar hook-associated protein 1 FlgK
MLGLFGTLNLASRSMQTQMAGVEVSGQNLANINTTGYSRQRVQIASSPDIVTGIGPEGTGASAVAIQQVVSNLVNNQIQSQNTTSGYWNSQQTALQSAQNGLNEFLSGSGSTSSTSATSTDTSGSGLSGQLSGLFAAFQSVATSPTSVSARQALVGQAQTLATTFNNISSSLSGLHDSLNESLNNDVGSANQLLTDIAGLNKQIASSEFSGGNANNLRDTRQQDLENLAKLTNITTSTGTNGAVNVTVGGETLVAGYKLQDTLQTYDAGGGQQLIQTANGGVKLSLTGGSIQGTINARDGSLTNLQSSVNTLAASLITQVNTLHSGGYSLTGTNGNNFFSGTDAATISVNAALANDPSLIQASGSATATGDNSVALQLAQLAASTQTTLGNQTFNGSYDATVANLGAALNYANTQVTNQGLVSTMLTTQRGSVSGVNTDEEMTSLLSFQQAYQASASVVKSVNEMLTTTIALVV